jgi:phosphate starvation-inducible PhoH-like protein
VSNNNKRGKSAFHQSSNTSSSEKEPVRKAASVVITARTQNQKLYCRLLDSSADIVFATGPAGTGKTYIAVLHAIRAFLAGQVDKIIITRPNVEAGDPIGFLPGDKNKKMEPWTAPIIDVFKEVFTPIVVQQMLEREEIMVEPLAFMRGRTFKNAIILGDEMQNTTPEQMIMFLTRIGEGSRIICTGDLNQHDRGHARSGLTDALERFDRCPTDRVTEVHFTAEDVQRHEVIPHVLRAYA